MKKTFKEILNTTKKPANLVISDVKWKYIVRTILKGQNLMLLGTSGSGKTFAVNEAAKELGRNVEKFNLGASQDPQTFLCGALHLLNGETKYIPSAFADAIQVPNNVILLDEITRKHPEAGNILMSILDEDQKYMRLDNHPDKPVIRVADGVSFLATGNVGAEYTSTRKMDKALYDRFEILEMDLMLADEEELFLINRTGCDQDVASGISKFMSATRELAKDPSSPISNLLGSRISLRLAGLIVDGFTAFEACEVAILPLFDDQGGEHNERYIINQLMYTYFNESTGKELWT